MKYSMDYVIATARRKEADISGVVVSLNTYQEERDERMAFNAAKAPPTSEEVEEPPVQPSALSIGVKEPEQFKARTYDHNFDTKNTPTKKYLIDDYISKNDINLLVAEGGAGKSSLTLVEAISIATNRNLLGLGPVTQGNVLIINNEDDDNELDRRIGAICIYYGISTSELNNKLFVRSGYEKPIKVAEEFDRNVIESADVKPLIDFINDNKIDMVVFDPYISTHDSNENDNTPIGKVVQLFRAIAAITEAAIRLVHHTRKSGNSHTSSAGDIEIARGAGALKDGARVCHTLVSMTNKEADEFGIDREIQQRLVRVDGAKSNYFLKKPSPNWFYKESVSINNGESVGVIRPYQIGPKIKGDKPSVGDKSKKILHNIGYAIIAKCGIEGGVVEGPKLSPIYEKQIERSSSTVSKHFDLLPKGVSKSERLNLSGKFYRIHQEIVDKNGVPRLIHLHQDE